MLPHQKMKYKPYSKQLGNTIPIFYVGFGRIKT